MKKLFLAIFVLTLVVFTMASCDTNNGGNGGDNGPTCEHPEESLKEVFGKKATCTEDGYNPGVMCTLCGATISGREELKATGHRGMKVDAVEATCETNGITEGSRCGFCLQFLVAQQIIPKLPHQEVANIDTAPTCTTPGSTGGTHCSVCFNAIQPATEVPATGHTLEETKAATVATCESPAMTAEKSCTVCNNIIEAQKAVGEVDANNHVDGCEHTASAE